MYVCMDVCTYASMHGCMCARMGDCLFVYLVLQAGMYTRLCSKLHILLVE